MPKPRATISFDEDLYAVLKQELARRQQQEESRVSLAELVNEALGGIYADQVAELKKQKVRQHLSS